MKAKEEFTKKLLVEGNDDRHVMLALRDRHNLPKDFDVIDCGGIDNLEKRIPVTFKVSGIEAVGIIIDADENLQLRWSALRSRLSAAGFDMPDSLPKAGLIVENDLYRAGLWIMPDNNASGMLEDFVSLLIPKNDALLPVVQSTLSSIEAQKLNKYALAHKSKAAIHTWLAWQETPGTPIGLSITKKYLTATDAACQAFVEWIKKLFG
ncbi:MAG: hypothetical protein LBB79_00370 [Prevotellaceae bacterium]|jgi:hypothetical protein|nr:hypothetical protein [Prevotellaceae bacterium]